MPGPVPDKIGCESVLVHGYRVVEDGVISIMLVLVRS